MIEIINLISSYFLGDLSPFPRPRGLFSLRLIANLGALFFLVFGYVLGCRALYHYMEPQWGEVLTLLALCALLLTTSLILFLIGWFLKPKEPLLKDLISSMEKALTDIPNTDMAKKIISMVTPKTVATLFAIVVVTSYLTKFKKRV